MKRILIIEDDDVIAEVQKDYLEANGFEVVLAADGEKGWQEAATGRYDLILLDLMLPGMDGFEICRRIRPFSNVPILMVSARKEEVDKIRGLGLGADDYIIKPFSIGELVARVKAHLARFERLTSPTEEAQRNIDVLRLSGGLIIDRKARKVQVGGRDVPLPSKEFDLLLFLATHPNRVFTKEELFERIWGLDAMGDLATVTVHISRLRDKLESDPAKPQYIETVWGVGYRFIL